MTLIPNSPGGGSEAEIIALQLAVSDLQTADTAFAASLVTLNAQITALQALPNLAGSNAKFIDLGSGARTAGVTLDSLAATVPDDGFTYGMIAYASMSAQTVVGGTQVPFEGGVRITDASAANIGGATALATITGGGGITQYNSVTPLCRGKSSLSSSDWHVEIFVNTGATFNRIYSFYGYLLYKLPNPAIW